MPSITLTVLITAIVVVKSPITVDSSPPPPDRHPDWSRDRSDDHPNNTAPAPTRTRPPPPPPPPPPATLLLPPIVSSTPSPDPNLSKTRSTHPGSKQPTRKVNLGRKIGLLFVGMAGLLQVAVVGFLGFRRWQISNIKEDSPP